MDREHVKGMADKAKGAVKEGAGKKLAAIRNLKMRAKPTRRRALPMRLTVTSRMPCVTRPTL